MSEKARPKRYYRKRVDLFLLLHKIKLWPSRTGILHGIKTIKEEGTYAEMTTHCGEYIIARNSKNSRAARWIRNKWMRASCKKCRVPAWKLDKFSATAFTQHYGSDLSMKGTEKERGRHLG